MPNWKKVVISGSSAKLANETFISGHITASGIVKAEHLFSTDDAEITNDLVVGGNIDLEGNIDVNGTSNLDAVDIDGNVDVAGNLTFSGAGRTLANSTGNLTVDVAGDIILDAADNDILFKDAGTHIGTINMSSQNLSILSSVSDKDIIFKGNDGGSTITALTLDMSAAGAATFNNSVTATGLDINGNADISGDLTGLDNITSTNYVVGGHTIDDIDITAEFVDADAHIMSSKAIGARFAVKNADTTGQANTAIALTTGNKTIQGVLSITGDGSNAATLTESTAGDFTIAAVDDLRLEAGGNDLVLRGASSAEFGRLSNSSQDFVIQNITSNKDILFNGNDGGGAITALTLDMSDAGTAIFNNGVYIPNHVLHTGDGNTKFGFPAADTFEVQTGGTQALQLDSSQNAIFGGNVSASGHLNVVGDITSSAIIKAEHFHSTDDAEITNDLVVGGNIDLEGNIDVNGTANLDAVDIDGAVDMASTLTVAGNLLIASNLQHVGDDNNELSFGTDTQDFRTNNSSRLDISNSGVRLGGANARVTTVLDEDAMGSNSATALATQQSIKAYVDGITVTDTTNAAHVLITDNESTNEENQITFVEGAAGGTANRGLEADGNLTYNPSTGTVTATVFKGNIDAVDGDFDGTLEADAITVGGTALNTVIAGVTVTNATNAAHVLITDNESTNEHNQITFVEGAAGGTANRGLEADGDFTYNPSKGLVIAPHFSASGRISTVGAITGSTGKFDNIISDDYAIGGHTINDLDITSEFVDANDHLMSSKAIGARFALKNADTTGTATNATNAAHVLITDNESTSEENQITFVEGAAGGTANRGLEADGNLTYNPSTGTVTATIFKGNIDAVDGDFDGTLEADAITVGGTALNTVIAGVTVTNASTAAVATTVTITDNESTNENNPLVFVAGGDLDGGNLGLESDGTTHYNPSTGTITATVFKGNIDAVDGDFDGTLEADAITVGGTALNTVIAGVTVTNSTNAAHVLVTDNESTDEENQITFIEGAGGGGANRGLEADGNLTYNPSSGTVTATIFKGNIDAVNGDFDGTLEADAITVGGTALATVITNTTVDQASTATNATNAAHVLITDNESTNEENQITFIEGAGGGTANRGLEADGNLTYNPSTGTVSATIFKGNIDAVDGDFDGTLEADAITVGGTNILTGGIITTLGTIAQDTIVFQSSNADDPLLTIENNANDATGARLLLLKDKGAAGADGDEVGEIVFAGDDDAQQQTNFVKLRGLISDASNGAEGGKFEVRVATHDGEMQPGLIVQDGSAEDEIDVTIGNGVNSVVTMPGFATIESGLKMGDGTYIGSTSVDDIIYLENDGTTTFSYPTDFSDDVTMTSGKTTISHRKFAISSTTHGNSGGGDVVYFGSTTSMTAGKIYYYNSSGNWALTDADAVATADGMIGVALGAASNTNGVMLRGMTTLNHDPGTVGDPLFLSTTAGQATSTAPSGNGDIVRVIGYCLGSTNGEIYFNPSGTFVEVTA
jgi:hypothetical protein